MIEVDRVSKQFGHFAAVRDVSLCVHPGVVTGLLGPNGAGKTTLIRMMTSFLTPTRGHIRVCGFDAIENAGDARRCIGYLPESAPLYPEMRVREFLLYRARLFGVDRHARSPAVDGAMASCAITDMAARRIGHLSKGYRQRVGLAAAVLHDPAVLILDEPSSGLDPTQIRELRSLIRQLAHGGPTGQRVVLLSSHYLPEVQQTCDRIAIIARGQLRADGTPDALLKPLRDAAPIRMSIAGANGGACGATHATANTGSVPAEFENLANVSAATLGLGSNWKVTAARSSAEPSTTLLTINPPTNELAPETTLGQIAKQRGWTITQLRRDEPTLEQLFLNVIEHIDDSTTPANPSPPSTPPAPITASA